MSKKKNPSEALSGKKATAESQPEKAVKEAPHEQKKAEQEMHSVPDAVRTGGDKEKRFHFEEDGEAPPVYDTRKEPESSQNLPPGLSQNSQTEATESKPDIPTQEVAHGHGVSIPDKATPQSLENLERQLAVFKPSTAHTVIQTLPDGEIITKLQQDLAEFMLRCEQDAVYHAGSVFLCYRAFGKAMEFLSTETGLVGYRLYDRYRMLSGSKTGDKQLSRYKRLADNENWTKIENALRNPLMEGVALTWAVVEELLKPGDEEGTKIEAARQAAQTKRLKGAKTPEQLERERQEKAESTEADFIHLKDAVQPTEEKHVADKAYAQPEPGGESIEEGDQEGEDQDGEDKPADQPEIVKSERDKVLDVFVANLEQSIKVKVTCLKLGANPSGNRVIHFFNEAGQAESLEASERVIIFDIPQITKEQATKEASEEEE